jgi:hypothetical protein
VKLVVAVHGHGLQPGVVDGGPHLVIRLVPGPEAKRDDRCRIEEDILCTEVQLVCVIDRLIVELEAVRNVGIQDAIPLETHGQASVGVPIREAEAEDIRKLEANAG